MKRVIGTVVWAVAVAAATGSIILIEIGLWADPPDYVTWPAVAILTCAAFAPSVANAVRTTTDRSRHKLETAAMDAFRVALVLISERSGVGYERLGFNCLIVPGWYRRTMKRSVRKRLFGWLSEHHRDRLGSRPVLRSVKKFRISPDPPSSGIRWTRQKGVIGLCWRERKTVGLDVRDTYGPYLGLDRTAWEQQVPPEVRLGLSYGDWTLVGDKYSAVVVSPILVRGEFWGCITLDATCSDAQDDDYSRLWAGDVQSALLDAAIYVGAWLAPEVP